ncbi:MAG: hypothetical protein ACI94Y_003671 [Maribacter sp.]|jgi:hypothetical protein
MKHVIFTLIIFLSFLSSNVHAQLSINGYTNYAISGFDVLVQENAFVMDADLTNEAIDLLESSLAEIVEFNIDQAKVDLLKEVPIFMDWNTTTGAAQYHPSEAWLIENGYIPEKARCVEISNITNFVAWTNQNQPYMVLHELAHAYHHRVLNFNSAVITNAYNNAISNNLYTNVSYHAGNGNYFNQDLAYALNNDKEFFAEITEAYFGLNDYFPFDYDDLNNYDIVGFNAVVEVWGDNTVSINNLDLEELSLYPNPSDGIITLATEDLQLNGLKYELIDSSGRIILASESNNESKSIRIDITDESGGIYFLRLIQDSFSKVFKVIKR